METSTITVNVTNENNGSNAPIVPFRTHRGLTKMLLLGILTLGIYPIVVESHISEELNIVIRGRDGRHTMHYCVMFFLLSWLTLGIAAIVWYHRSSDRMGYELMRRQIPYSFGSSDFWLWCVLGSLIYIGPWVYIHKRMKAMNLINAHYNRMG